MLPKNLLLPVVVIFLGVTFLLGNMGMIPSQILSLWPVILVVAGLVGLTSFDLGDKKSPTAVVHPVVSKGAAKTKKKVSTKKKK